MQAPGTPPWPPRERQRERVWFAHAIRGPACLLVVFAHLFDLFPNFQPVVARMGHFVPIAGLPVVPWAGSVRSMVEAGVSPGAVGVSLFFLVSGFVIPFSLQVRNPRGFFIRRFFRLYPTLWLCLAVTLLVLAVQAQVDGTPIPYAGPEVATNAFLVSPYVGHPWLEPVFWSLAVEELFYAVAAIGAMTQLLASRVAILAGAVGLTLVAVATRGAAAGSALSWLGFNAGSVCFIFIGVVAHWVYRGAWGRGEGLAIAAAILGLYAVANHHGPVPGTASLYLRSGLVALIVFGILYLARETLPYSRALDRLSDISYPLYLVHGVTGYVLLRAMFALTSNFYVSAGVTVAAAVLLAAAIHRWVETPTNAFGRRISRRWQEPDTPSTAPAPVAVAVG